MKTFNLIYHSETEYEINSDKFDIYIRRHNTDEWIIDLFDATIETSTEAYISSEPFNSLNECFDFIVKEYVE